MRYFITGCTGFIGIHLCRLLLSKDHEVFGLVRNPQKIPPDLRDNLRVIRGDLGIFQNSGIELPSVDVVIHLAGVVAGRNCADYMKINFEAVQHLLGALNRQKWKPKRFVFASSLAAAGPSLNGVALRETDEARPIDPYGIAKLKAEHLLDAQPFPTTAFRPPIVLGPGDPAGNRAGNRPRAGEKGAHHPASRVRRQDRHGIGYSCGDSIPSAQPI
jgi:nucleoside-diphosphate-sugar epimerase